MIERRVLTRYEADSSGQERALDRIRAKVETARGSFANMAKGASDGAKQMSDDLGKFNQAFEGYTKVLDMARDSVKAYGEELRLRAAAGKTDIDSLSTAFDGLVNKHDLLTFAAQAQHGVLKLNQEQLETIAKAAVVLSRNGFELSDAFDKLKNAAVKAKAEGLDDLGLSVKEGATSAETLKNLMDELNRKIAESGETSATAADEVQQYTVMFENLKNEMLIVNGQYTVMMTKAVETGEALKKYLPVYDAMAAYQRGFRNGAGRSMFANGFGDDEAAAPKQYELTVGPAVVTRSGAPKNDNSRADELKRLADSVAKSETDALIDKLEEELAEIQAAQLRAVSNLGQAAQLPVVDYATMIRESSDALEAAAQKAANIGRGESLLAQMFGTPEEFSIYKEIGQVFDAFTDAVASSYEALVTGAEPAGKALKKVFADGLLAMGKSEIVQGIKEEAWAIGELAIGNIPGFTLHQVSAAKHAAAAVAAGVAANAIGTSSQVNAADKAAEQKASANTATGGTSNGGGSGTAKPGTTTIIYAFADPFAIDSPRARAREAQRMVQKVTGGNAGSDS